MPSGAGWPILKQQRLEIAAANLFAADVRALCEPGPSGSASDSMELLAEVDAALPALSNAITHTYFSHAEQERTDVIYRVVHRTTYDYEDPVSVSHHLVRLTPRNIPGQVCRETGISIAPSPDRDHHSRRLFRKRRDVLHAAGAARAPDRRSAQYFGIARTGAAGFLLISGLGDCCPVAGQRS
jgi:hypothetical protein